MPMKPAPQTTEIAPWPSAAVKRLDRLVGKWSIEIYLPSNLPKIVSGVATFDWLQDGYFLLERSEIADPAFPQSIAMIGCDAVMEGYSMIYYDSRGVSRIYQMSLNDEEWTLLREEPEFWQRFVGRFSDKGDVIKGYWEKSLEGENWDLDFDVVYTKLSPAQNS